ncbi:amiloride-sensitive sodium channel subunit beta [Brachionus plicatilis]|uniref:Amiloride-sensitive sodium channel subunit beta n=1 Tax=Brachionus plicatilis TaxID=10195 RepID=A0A3M7RTD1_BRAPC|nr:amiloride-sensitive sodium channel subunit beta [Brachionus plicatilis]
MDNSEEFNENEFNEWLMMNNQNDQYLNSSENEEFDKFISGTYFVENNSNDDKNLDNSPSYSPLEDINSQYPFSQVIELDKQLEKRLKTGIDKIHSITIDSYIENLENLHIKDNKIEIVVDSDDESPWSKMSHFEIVNDYLENLKLKISTPQSLEKLDQVCEQKRKTDETFNEDYLYRFSESLELVKKMLDIIEKSEADELNSKCEKQLNLSNNSKDNPIAKGSFDIEDNDTEDNLKQNFEAKRCCYVPSSITITKLRKKISFKILESFTCLSIKNNEKFIKMNYDQIEKIFVKLISNCIEQVEINCEVNDINFDLVKKMAEKNTSKLFFPWYLLLQFCFKSLDLLFNCSWSDFLQYMKSFMNDYQYLPEIKNSLELVFNEIEKTITDSGHIFNEIQSPKVMILFEFIQKESEKFKDLKGNKTYKLVIVVPRKSNELCSSLLCQMRSLTHIKTCIIHTDSHYTLSDFENLKSNNDCLIVDYHTSLFDKLSEFTHLIMYEQLGETGSVKNNLELCAKLNIKYVEFEKYNINFFDEIEHNLTENDKFRTVICSERVANNTFLVELIEIEQGIKLVTRNYEYIAAENNLNNSFICNADILVNENVGIVFQECSHFMNYFEDEINLFFTKIVNFRLSLVNLFVIFTFSDTIESNFNFVNLNGNSSNFKLGPLFLGDFEKLRILLKKIFENFQSSTPACYPAVVICNLNAYDGKIAREDMNRILTEKNISLESYEPIDFVDIAADYFKSTFQTESLKGQFDLYYNGFFLSQMLISCRYQGVKCEEKDFEHFHDYHYGNCYRFNGDKNNVIKSKKSGWRNGLRLELYIGDLDLQQQYTYKAGMRLIIHNQSDIPFTNENGIDVSVGSQTNIAISRTMIKRKTYPYSNCIENHRSEKNLKRNSLLQIITERYPNMTKYSQNYCLKVCLQEYFMKRCECFSLSLPRPDNSSVNLTGCETIDQLLCIHFEENVFFNGTEIEKCYKNCPNECFQVTYNTQVSTAKYPSKWYTSILNNSTIFSGFFSLKNSTFTELQQTILMINVYYEQMYYNLIEEYPELKADALFANVGGILGLFLGISVMSLIEMSEIFFYLIYLIFKRYVFFSIKKVESINLDNTN